MKYKIPYGKQSIDESDINSVVEVLRSDYLTQGPKVLEFEKKIANFCGSKYAVACSSGTAALHLSYQILSNKSKRGKVLTTALSFSATSNALMYCGLIPEFVDIDNNNYCISINELGKKIKANPEEFVGIAVVHYAGYPIDMMKVKEIADNYNLWVVEDSCHALGGSFINNDYISKIGSSDYSSFSTFSFHPVKHITTGEGGMVTTNDKSLYEQLLLLRSHGIKKDFNHDDELWRQDLTVLGFNYRMSDINAALGVSQLDKLERFIKVRNEIAEYYNENLSDLPITLPEKCNHIHAYHLYVILTDFRKDLYHFLREKNIFTQVHYVPICEMSLYTSLIDSYGSNLKNTNYFYNRCLSLPIYPDLKRDEQDYVIDSIKKFFGKI